MNPTQPYLINDVLELIIAHRPRAFVRVNKWCHNRVLSGFTTGKYHVPILKYDGMIMAAKGASDEIFGKLVDRVVLSAASVQSLTIYTINNKLYTKTKVLAQRYNTVAYYLYANPDQIAEYYEIYGIDGIQISSDIIIVAGNFNMLIRPSYLLPMIPLRLIDALYAQFGDIIRDHYDIYAQHLFVNSTHERIYEIFKHHRMIHYRLIRKMAATGVEWIEKLLNAGVIVSLPMHSLDEMMRLYERMDATSPIFVRLRQCIADTIGKDEGSYGEILKNMCDKLDGYILATDEEERNIAAIDFIKWIDANDAIIDAKRLLKLCIAKGYDLLAKHLLRSRIIMRYCNNKISYQPIDVQTLIPKIIALLHLTQVDISTVEDRPIYKIMVLLLCYIHRFDPKMMNSIAVLIDELSLPIKAAISAIQNLILYVAHTQHKYFHFNIANFNELYISGIDIDTCKFIFEYSKTNEHPYYRTPDGYL